MIFACTCKIIQYSPKNNNMINLSFIVRNLCLSKLWNIRSLIADNGLNLLNKVKYHPLANT